MRQNIVSCNKSGKLSTAEYITPSEEHYQCEYCKGNFLSKKDLGLHWQKCANWKKQLKEYEESKDDDEISRPKSEGKGDMEELGRLFKCIKGQTLEMDECKSSRCIIKPRYYKLFHVALKLIKEADLLIKEKNGEMHHKNLVI